MTLALAKQSCPIGTESSTLFRRGNLAAAWIVLLLAVLHPPDGLGIPLCWARAVSGAPCPGCGLSRSASCVVRGRLAQAWAYHPFGLVVPVLAVPFAIASLLPRDVRRRMNERIRRDPRWLNAAYAAVVGAFLAYGAIRAVRFWLA